MTRIQPSELKEITDLIFEKYGYDFRNYAMSSFERRVIRMLDLKHLTVKSLLKTLSDQPSFVEEFLKELTVNVTEMFRDDGFWRSMREEIIPTIRSEHSKFNIWHAGCSSGEEVYSMAILLAEMGLSDDSRILASDLDPTMLVRARVGSYPLKSMETNEKNYAAFRKKAGTLRKYYTEENGRAVLRRELQTNISFVKHDLVTAGTTHKFNLILCRNVMIYFNQALQNEVLIKFHKSLEPSGFLAIGSKESLIWCDVASKFSVVNSQEKIYRKIKD
jgi:chemotaxis protein methyltransferase CheR